MSKYDGGSLPVASSVALPRSDAIESWLSTVEASQDAILLAVAAQNESGQRILYVNPEFSRLTGYQPAEALGRSPEFLHGPRTSAEELNRLHAALATRCLPISSRLLNYGKTGDPILVDLTLSDLHCDGHDFLVERRRPVDEKTQSQAILIATQQVLYSIVETSPYAMFITDAQGHVSLWNSAAEHLFGWSSDDIMGCALPMAFAGAEPELKQLNLCALSGQTVKNAELPCRRKDGAQIQVQISCAPTQDPRGGGTAALFIATDITQQQLPDEGAQRQLRFLEELLEAIPNPVYFKDRDGRYLGFNRAYEKLLGIKREDWYGKRAEDLFPDRVAAQQSSQDTPPLEQEIAQTAENHLTTSEDEEKSALSGGVENSAGIIGVLTGVDGLRDTEAALYYSRERLALALRSSNVSLWDADLRTNKVYLDETWSKWFDQDEYAQTVPIDALLERVHPADVLKAHETYIRTVKGEIEEFVIQLRVKTADNGFKWILSRGKVVERDENAWALRLIGTNQDITEQKRIQERIRESEERFRLITENVSDLIALLDTDGRRIYSSPSYKNLFGDQELLPGTDSFEQVHPDDREQIVQLFQDTVRTGIGRRARYRFQVKGGGIHYIESDGNVIRDEAGNITNVVVVSRDITDRLRFEEKLSHLAHHDLLTGLPNRVLLQDRLEHALQQAFEAKTIFAVIYVDLDDFKDINDLHGHGTGDQLLRAVAQRLTQAVRSDDTVARQGGDEFIVLLQSISTEEEAMQIAERLRTAIALPFQVGHIELQIAASIGLSLYPQHGRDADTLSKNADTAMYLAKKRGKNSWHIFNEKMQRIMRVRQQLDRTLREGYAKQQFVLYYQPQYRIDSGELCGFEALVRWKHPELGLIGPTHFVHLAEENGLIIPLGAWVLETACRQAVRLSQSASGPISMAVNISAKQLRANDLVETVKRALDSTGLAPNQLELEITETVLMQRVDDALQTMVELEKLGVSLSIDDFGTGYSSLAYLKSFRVRRLKIDRTFIRDITTDDNDAAIVRAVQAMANQLGIEIVAEGIESQEQFEFLRQIGCHYGQGFWLGKPCGSENLAAVIAKKRWIPSALEIAQS